MQGKQLEQKMGYVKQTELFSYTMPTTNTSTSGLVENSIVMETIS